MWQKLHSLLCRSVTHSYLVGTCGPLHRNLFTSQFSFSLCLFSQQPSEVGLWTFYEGLICEHDGFNPPTKGIHVLRNEEVKESRGEILKDFFLFCAKFLSRADQTHES